MNDLNSKHILTEEASNKILTIPNVISIVRLCLIPLYICMLFFNQNVYAAIIFAVAALTDWVDGQVARRTNSISKLGQILDPTVDRLLMLSSVFVVTILGRLPIWIFVLIFFRDILFLLFGSYLIKCKRIRIPVIYAGKITTTLLFIGFAGLILYTPIITGLGIVSYSWLPGLNSNLYCWGIWFVYAGLILGLFTSTYYIRKAIAAFRQSKKEKNL